MEMLIESFGGRVISDFININISIPVDNKGYILLKWPLCGGLFKLITII